MSKPIVDKQKINYRAVVNDNISKSLKSVSDEENLPIVTLCSIAVSYFGKLSRNEQRRIISSHWAPVE